jgi:hypothetical protein
MDYTEREKMGERGKARESRDGREWGVVSGEFSKKADHGKWLGA